MLKQFINKTSLWSSFVLLLLLGCAQVKLREVDKSLPFINKTLTLTLPLGVESISSNGREYFSKKFSPSKWTEEPKEGHPSAFAKVLILGDRRPYDLEVHVYVTQVLHGKFQQKESPILAKRLARKIDDTLAQRPEDRNVIDDFRVF